MKRLWHKCLVLTGILFGVISPLSYADAASNSGYVCDVNVDFRPVYKPENTFILGTMEQTCNARRGYQVIAEGGPALADAVMLVSGRPVVFDDTGVAVLIDAKRPGSGSNSLVLTTHGARPSSLSIRIEARV